MAVKQEYCAPLKKYKSLHKHFGIHAIIFKLPLLFVVEKIMSSQFTKCLALMTGSTVILLGNMSAADAFMVFTNRTAWETAIAGNPIITDTFSTVIPSAQTINLVSGIVSTNSADITLPNAFNNNSTSVDTVGQYANATQALGAEPPPHTASDNITWTFPQPTFAFGADFFSAGDGRLTLEGNFDGTGTQILTVFNSIGGSNGFLGVVGNANFDSIIFSNNITTVDGFFVDNASFVVPEPFTILGSSTAVILGALFKRKVKKS